MFKNFLSVGLLVTNFFVASQSFATNSMQDIVDWYAAEGFSGHVLVVRGNDTLIDQKIGLASFADNQSFAERPQFYIGSVSKQFTSAAILRLQERGLLSVNDSLSKYLTDAPHAGEITLHQLLTHTSGLKNFTDLDEFWEGFALNQEMTPNQLIDFIRSKDLQFAPGTKWEYCNTGYVLLGMIIEKISGKPWGEFINEEFLTPLGMSESGYTPGQDPLSAPKGHTWDQDYKPVFQDHGNMSWAYAAGGLHATVYDMLKWSRALHVNHLLTDASYDAMTTPVMEDYGYGLIITSIGDKKVIAHGGGLPGFTCQILSIPSDDAHVIVLGNLAGDLPSNLSYSLTQILAGESVDLPSHITEVLLDHDQNDFLGKYKFTYADGRELLVSIFDQNNGLYLQADGQSAWRLLYQGQDKFAVRVENILVDFKRNSSGTIESFTLHQSGEDSAFIKQ